ncbi:hypothetical protein [Rhizobium azibense]|uniref:Uncharacterized protein n=1 Tax=Rhizobium azibense TaxID=1136135 RepID=A0A4R3RP21_9HYPH|nr:hypothetical protein [Rhizobium azibense]TCU33276.1 hypothetical protein EV129_11634 [Rhizobium azibense]
MRFELDEASDLDATKDTRDLCQPASYTIHEQHSAVSLQTRLRTEHGWLSDSCRPPNRHKAALPALASKRLFA